MSSLLAGSGSYSQTHSLTFVEDVGLDYGGDTQGLNDYVYDEFTLPSQTQASQSQTTHQTPAAQGERLPTMGVGGCWTKVTVAVCGTNNTSSWTDTGQ